MKTNKKELMIVVIMSSFLLAASFSIIYLLAFDEDNSLSKVHFSRSVL